MRIRELHSKSRYRKALFLPALFSGYFLAATFAAFFSMVLIDVASSFNVTVGTASLISVISRFVGLIMGLVISVLALKFRHKSMFLFGVAMYGVGALGSSAAPDFYSMLFFQFFLGIGGAMVTVMMYALIGEFLPLEKKGQAVGLAWSTAFLASVIVPLVTFVIANAAGWRFVLSLFVFPFSVFCLVLSYFVIPSSPVQNKPAKDAYLKAFKQIILNKSAVACMVGTMLVQITYTFTVYAVSFYRLNFSLPLLISSICASAVGSMAILGSAVGGRLINRIGRKTLTVVAGLFSGVFTLLFTYIPSLWISVGLWGGAIFLIAMALSAIYNLNLEQVPRFRGTLMSLNQTFRYAGTVLGLLLGGFVLNFFSNNFQILMTIYGASSVVMAILVFSAAKDVLPTT
jgi:predicted MFS family arabinose efflux permease